MLAHDEHIDWLISAIERLRQESPKLIVVYDPVAAASAGGVTTEVSPDGLKRLYPYLNVITPNMPEAEKLTGIYLGAVDDIAKKFHQFGIEQIVIKGGHTDDDACTDHGYVFNEHDEIEHKYSVTSAKVNTNYSHGGGCSFASSITGLLAHGCLLRDALTITKAFMHQGLKANEGKLFEYGPFEQTAFPASPEVYPYVELTKPLVSLPSASFAELGIKRDGSQALGLYPVVDSLEWLEKLMPLGIEIIQLRIKNLEGEALSKLIKSAVELSQNYKTRLFINDHWQLAIEHGAYGIHLGQEDIFEADLAAIQASGCRLGISTHGVYEFLLAQQLKPSYLAIGAIYPTKTKDMTGQIQGIDTLTNTLNVAQDIPVVAIGGINHERAPDVWQTGTDSIAVVTAITEAEDYKASVDKFKAIMN